MDTRAPDTISGARLSRTPTGAPGAARSSAASDLVRKQVGNFKSIALRGMSGNKSSMHHGCAAFGRDMCTMAEVTTPAGTYRRSCGTDVPANDLHHRQRQQRPIRGAQQSKLAVGRSIARLRRLCSGLPQRFHQVELIEQRKKFSPLAPCLLGPTLAGELRHQLLLANELKFPLRDDGSIAIDGSGFHDAPQFSRFSGIFRPRL